MPEPHDALAPWGNFYLVIGGAAAALTGLQFVVIALVAQTRARGNAQTLAAYGTPTIVYFCAALLAAGIFTAPWTTLGSVRLVLLLGGLTGLAYVTAVTLQASRQKAYRPVFEDWLFHTILPTVAFIGILYGAARLEHDTLGSLFAVGTACLLMLFIGIHNSWDTVTYIVTRYAMTPTETETDVPAPPTTAPTPVSTPVGS
jgi:hypothetical protein